MSWFQLDPGSLAGRVIVGRPRTQPLTLRSSVVRGALGFCLVSVAGFVPWAWFGRPLQRALGEAGMYVVCALVFIALAGFLLHRLIMGSGSLGRFYRLFAIAFSLYSAGWILGWMLLGGHLGSLAGLLAGTAVMGWILTRAFDAADALFPVILVLFVANAAGYFVGGWIEAGLMPTGEWQVPGSAVPRRVQARLAMLVWGVCYGLGLGAGLGFAFHRCQRAARHLVRNAPWTPAAGEAGEQT